MEKKMEITILGYRASTTRPTPETLNPKSLVSAQGFWEVELWEPSAN